MQRIIKLTHLDTENLNSRLLHEQIFFSFEEQTFILMCGDINSVLSNIKIQAP